MAYQIDRFNGTFLVNVEDGSIESNTTDLRFVGKNYAGYGEVQNENFLHMLENFANTTPPPKVISGQIWYDSGEKKLKFYDGNKFRVTSGAETGNTAPAGLAIGEFWWDTSAKQLYTWSGTDFILVGPEASPELGVAGATPFVAKDTKNPPTNHTILRLLAGGKTVAIINQDEEFTLNPQLTPIEDFTLIKRGITLAKTNSVGSSTDGYIYWGTSSNSLNLGGVPASDFLQKGSLNLTDAVSFGDDGFQLGESNDLRVRVENNDELVIENRLGNDIYFRIAVNPNDRRLVQILNRNGVFPGADLFFNLGTSNLRYSNVFAGTFNGNLAGNVTGNVVGSTRGNLLSEDSTVMINSVTKQIGFPLADIRGVLTGSLVGNVDGTSTNSNRLNDIFSSEQIPGSEFSSKVSIPVRDSLGKLYASQFVGTVDKSDLLKIDNSAVDTDPNYRTAKTTPVANSIAARDNSGNLLAALFEGTATAARYADLAEKYLTDQEYLVGTVVAVGGEAEVRASNLGDRAIGVVSENPAFMMNKDLENGTYIALKGRVPVRVIGSVKKGDRLVATYGGCAMKADSVTSINSFAISLEDNNNENEKLVEAVVL